MRQNGDEDVDVVLRRAPGPLLAVKVPKETVPVSIGRRLHSGSKTIDAEVSIRRCRIHTFQLYSLLIW